MPKPDAATPAAGSALPEAPTTTPPVQAPAPDAKTPSLGWLADQYAGKGGDYVIDPKTGHRTPAKTEKTKE